MAKSNTLITIILVALIALAAGWYVGQEDLVNLDKINEENQEAEVEETPIVVEIPEKPVITLPELNGLEINIPDEDTTVQINQEASETSSSTSLFTGTQTDEETETTNTVTLVDNQLTAINADYFVIPFLLNTGGTGTFLYLGLLERTNEGVDHTQSVFLGDRIGFESISVENKIISIETLDRYEGQPFSDEPAVSVIRNYTLEDNQLVLIEEYVNVAPSEVFLSVSLTTETLFPIELTGSLPENWFFEGDFPVTILIDGETAIRTFGTRTESAADNGQQAFTATIAPEENLGDLANKEIILLLTKDNVSDERSLDANYQRIIAR